VRAVELWPTLFGALFTPDVPLREVAESGLWILTASLLFAVPAVTVSWILQCVIVMVRSKE